LINKHHILTRSRKGKDEGNIVMLPEWWHRAWHDCMGDLTPEEAVRFLQAVMKPGKRWNTNSLKAFRETFKND